MSEPIVVSDSSDGVNDQSSQPEPAHVPAHVELIIHENPHGKPRRDRKRTPYGQLPNVKQRSATVISFKLGRWPPGSNLIKRDGDDLRFILENALCERTNGIVDVQQAGLIQTACTHEIAARLAQQWLNVALRKEQASEQRIEQDLNSGLITPEAARGLSVHAQQLSPMEKLAYLKEIGNHRDQRDKCLQKLGLDIRQVENEWSSLDRRGPKNKVVG